MDRWRDDPACQRSNLPGWIPPTPLRGKPSPPGPRTRGNVKEHQLFAGRNLGGDRVVAQHRAPSTRAQAGTSVVTRAWPSGGSFDAPRRSVASRSHPGSLGRECGCPTNRRRAAYRLRLPRRSNSTRPAETPKRRKAYNWASDMFIVFLRLVRGAFLGTVRSESIRSRQSLLDSTT